MIRLANNIKQVNHLSMLTFQAQGLNVILCHHFKSWPNTIFVRNSLEKEKFIINCCLQLVILLHRVEFLVTQRQTLLSRAIITLKKAFLTRSKVKLCFLIIVLYSISLIQF